jgi:cytochrome c-type biogenesis protein CcmH
MRRQSSISRISFADSDAELAHDLRAEVYEMVQDGKSDEEIIEFLVARYGDFVLYKPPVKPSTYLLWFGPFALMLLAGVLLLRAVRRQEQKAQDVEISAADRKRLDDLLGESDSEEQKP